MQKDNSNAGRNRRKEMQKGKKEDIKNISKKGRYQKI